jgi:hypothetical protein
VFADEQACLTPNSSYNCPARMARMKAQFFTLIISLLAAGHLNIRANAARDTAQCETCNFFLFDKIIYSSKNTLHRYALLA